MATAAECSLVDALDVTYAQTLDDCRKMSDQGLIVRTKMLTALKRELPEGTGQVAQQCAIALYAFVERFMPEHLSHLAVPE